MTDTAGAFAAFDRALAEASEPDAPFDALLDLTRAIVGAKLFTFMTVDMEKELASRSYTSHPVDYPVSGTKPIHYNDWFDIVHGRHECFVANTVADIAKVFPDAELIGRLGCGSVINLPVVLGGVLVGTVNMLDVEHHYSNERVEYVETHLALPAKAAFLLSQRLSLPHR